MSGKPQKLPIPEAVPREGPTMGDKIMALLQEQAEAKQAGGKR